MSVQVKLIDQRSAIRASSPIALQKTKKILCGLRSRKNDAVAAMAPRQIMNEWTTDPTEICDTIAAEIRANQLHYSIWAGNYTVVLPGQLRQHFNDAGWSKADIRNYVFQQARVRRGEWAGVGKGSVVKDRADREYLAMESPDDLLVVAAGGPAGGFAQIIPPWLGTKSRASTVAVGACVDCEVP